MPEADTFSSSSLAAPVFSSSTEASCASSSSCGIFLPRRCICPCRNLGTDRTTCILLSFLLPPTMQISIYPSDIQLFSLLMHTDSSTCYLDLGCKEESLRHTQLWEQVEKRPALPPPVKPPPVPLLPKLGLSALSWDIIPSPNLLTAASLQHLVLIQVWTLDCNAESVVLMHVTLTGLQIRLHPYPSFCPLSCCPHKLFLYIRQAQEIFLLPPSPSDGPSKPTSLFQRSSQAFPASHARLDP